MDKPLEINLSSASDVKAFRIPPVEEGEGFYCSSWRKEDCLFYGTQNMVDQEGKYLLCKLSKSDGSLFSSFPILSPSHIEKAIDSSRYFRVTLENPETGQTAFLGLGFHRREDSFDFNMTVQDYFKRKSRKVEEVKEEDLGLEMGDGKIHVSLKGIRESKKTKKEKKKVTSFFAPPK
ncbi:adaptin ear-binding coat-associated protein 1 NECAP-1 [Aduncisulcus paluster]|uniref:Adaptin ear-binding coat-associated protein 1 NECAP-1 n=1 Tax=Aduncisulcus paluster TaxID=2918883 RepID=A0ABQ5JXX0_9EUKA|nr:adaptin ear-binding coat-associated protein 1 NECAP-1 [Aduncisulcus paluster]